MEKFWRYKIDHAIFWTGTVAFHAYTRLGLIAAAGSVQFVIEIVFRNTLLAGVIYFNLLFLIPRFAHQRRYAAYVAYLVASLSAYALLLDAHDIYLYNLVLGDVPRRHFFDATFYHLSIALFYSAFGVALYLSKEWYVQKDLIRRIEMEKLATELDYLKAQINPHFLFNSINTIFFQIDKQNTAARETLVTFSDMLRYQLYECNGSAIPVDREVAYLRNYTELQRIRKDGNYKIAFDCGSDVSNFSIVPLLLIPFIENAFKHVSHFTDRENRVDIRLQREGSELVMEVSNTCERRTRSSGGIGLKNVRRRLELLYPGRHRLTVRENEDLYRVELRLPVNS